MRDTSRTHEHDEVRHYSDGDSICVTTCDGGPGCPDAPEPLTAAEVTFKTCGHTEIVPSSLIWDSAASSPVTTPVACPRCGRTSKLWTATVIRP